MVLIQKKIARYGEKKVAELMANPGIVRNRLKVSATIGNAKAYLALEKMEKPLINFCGHLYKTSLFKINAAS